jgi:hypothetical protein
MPFLSVSNGTITELFKGNAKFGRPSEKEGGGWIDTAGKGNVIIQKKNFDDDSTSAVVVVRWTNYMGLDGMNGRIIPGLPILRGENSKEVYFKTSSTTTRGARHKAPFVFKFETVDEAEEFEMWWLLKNGSIASWKADDKAKDKAKEEGSHSNNNVPLKETTNNAASSTPLHKRKADPMIDGPLRKKVKDRNDSLDLVCVDEKKNNGNENTPPSLPECSDDNIPNSCVVGAFKAVVMMTTEVNINGQLRTIVKVKRSSLRSIAEDLAGKNEDNGIDSNDDNDNSKDSNDDDDDSSNDSSGREDVIIDEEDTPQSQTWTAAFASY